MIEPVGCQTVDEAQTAHTLGAAAGPFPDPPPHPREKPTTFRLSQPQVIAQGPECAQQAFDAARALQRHAVPASRQIRHDDAKLVLQLRHLPRPIRATRAQTVDQQKRVASSALEIMQRAALMMYASIPV